MNSFSIRKTAGAAMNSAPRPWILKLANLMRRVWFVLPVSILASVAVYILIHTLMDFPFPITLGITVSAIIPLIVALPIFLLVGTLHRQIEAQNRQLGELNEQKTVLMSLIAHDIRSPLATLQQTIGAATYDERFTQRAIGMLPIVDERIKRIISLLDSLLSWSRGSFDQQGQAALQVPLQRVTDEVISQLDDAIRAKQLTVSNGIAPEASANTHAELLSLVLRNLLTNAIKFTPEHGRIDIDCRERDGQLCLSITDSGIGMDPATLEQLFSGRPLTSRRGTGGETGSGIGLLLCKQLLHGIGGNIRAESRPGRGSTFLVTLSQAP
jgi:signal transduction histidine kinase